MIQLIQQVQTLGKNYTVVTYQVVKQQTLQQQLLLKNIYGFNFMLKEIQQQIFNQYYNLIVMVVAIMRLG